MGARALPRIERFFSTQNPKTQVLCKCVEKALAPRVSDHRAFFGNYPVYKKKLLISREQRATIRMLEESNLDTTGANRP
jgi:hypothetical protein